MGQILAAGEQGSVWRLALKAGDANLDYITWACVRGCYFEGDTDSMGRQSAIDINQRRNNASDIMGVIQGS